MEKPKQSTLWYQANQNIHNCLSEVVIGAIKEFEANHPIRQGIFAKDISDSDFYRKLTVIRYSLADKQETDFYGVISRGNCKCGCGAGNLDLAVVRLAGQPNLEETARRFKSYMGAKDFDRKADYGGNIENALFYIETNQMRIYNRLWTSASTVSGIQTPLWQARKLIGELTEHKE